MTNQHPPLVEPRNQLLYEITMPLAAAEAAPSISLYAAALARALGSEQVDYMESNPRSVADGRIQTKLEGRDMQPTLVQSKSLRFLGADLDVEMMRGFFRAQ